MISFLIFHSIYCSLFLYFSLLQTTISVKVNVDPDANTHKLVYKQYPQSWSDADSIPIPAANTAVMLDVVELLPATTYCLRVEADTGDVGEELIVDTQAVDCNNQPGACCIVQ